METNNCSLFGILSCLGGLLVLIFQGLASLMGKKNEWSNLVLGDFLNDFFANIFDKLPLQNLVESIVYDIALYQLLLGVGVFFIVVGLLLKD